MSDPKSPAAAVTPPVKADLSNPAPPVARQKSKARVWFKNPKTGVSELRGGK